MKIAGAHLAFFVALGLASAASAACGTGAGMVRVESVDARGELRLADGRIIRLAGIDPAAGASARLASLWAGREATLVAFAAKPDRWGRWPGDIVRGDSVSAASDLLSVGLARVKPEFETRACEEERLVAEAGARRASLGLWNEPDSVLDVGDAEGLAAADGAFVVVEGRVARVGVGRARVYLDFGRRGAFTIVAAMKAEPAFERRGIFLRALAGHAIRARGVLDDRFGPRMEISDPAMLERIGGARESKPGG